MSDNKPDVAQVRLAAFEEFMAGKIASLGLVWALCTERERSLSYEANREVFYAGFAAGQGAGFVSSLAAGNKPVK
jgi:hypothetical protein